MYFTSRDIHLILAYIWARPAILVAGKGRGGGNAFMPPTSKKLEGHIASGTFVCVCPLRFLMHSKTSEPCMLGF